MGHDADAFQAAPEARWNPAPSRPRGGPHGGWAGLAGAMLAVVVAGCGAPTMRYTVEGVLTIDGKPAPQGMQIRFTPDQPAAESGRGVTDDSGRYVTYHRPGMKGLPPGRYVVSLMAPGDDDSGAASLPPWLSGIRIPDRYRKGRSALACEVRAGGVVFDIDVETR